MTYWITIYNRQDLGRLKESDFIASITQSDYHTLCEQYDLDENLIAPALSHLRLLKDPGETSSFFLLRYGPEGKRPLVVNRWTVDSEVGQAILGEAMDRASSDGIRARLKATNQILTIALAYSQLQNMGLLLGYEIARWSAWQGEGIMEGLDGLWYRLNRHQAFLPIEPDTVLT